MLTYKALLCFTKNAVHLGAANWADALCHATTRVRNLYGSFEFTLLLALYAVGLTFICLCHMYHLQSTHPGGPLGVQIEDYPPPHTKPRSFTGG